MQPSWLGNLRTANGKTGGDGKQQIPLHHFAGEVDVFEVGTRIEKNRPLAWNEGLIRVDPFAVLDGVLREFEQARVELVDRGALGRVREDRTHGIGRRLQRIGDHRITWRHVDRDVANHVVGEHHLSEHAVKTITELGRLRVHVIDRFAAGFGRRQGLPVLQVGGRLDFIAGAFRNLKLELKRAIRKANAGVQMWRRQGPRVALFAKKTRDAFTDTAQKVLWVHSSSQFQSDRMKDSYDDPAVLATSRVDVATEKRINRV